MKSPGIVLRSRADTRPETEVAALSHVYRFIFDCHTKRRGRLLDNGGPDDPERRSDEIRAKGSIS
jgi:hypothetical protein